MLLIIFNFLISFVLGVIIGLYFIKSNVFIYKAPSSESVKKRIIYDEKNNICYKLVPKVHICPIKYSMSN